jgi:O-antigen/teichoic acid export membrane protein
VDTSKSDEARRDRLTILSGTGQNILGLAAFVVATFATNVLISRALGPSALGTVTLATQFAFVAAAATRFGMDMAAVRLVAIDLGRGEPGRVRGVLSRAAAIAAVVSVAVAVPVFVGASSVASLFGVGGQTGTAAFRAAALALPFAALVQVYLGGTRGLKVMRHTLTIYWAGQPLGWIVLMLVGWSASRSIGMSVLAYAVSWIGATVAAWWVWERDTRPFGHLPPEPKTVRSLLRYGAPRAPAALLSQSLFWADYFVAALYVSPTDLGVYAAALRVAQVVMLFLTAVNYMFSPFVADLHARGERERLDDLYKSLTRWIVAGTIPLLLVVAIMPGTVLLLFGGAFDQGTTALRILLIGQAVNVAVGSVGFILIMVGRTGWDLAVYAVSFALEIAAAFLLTPRYGINGAAVAQAATMAFSNLMRLYLVWRFVRIQPFTAAYARLAIPAAVGGVVMAAVHAALGGTAWPVDLVLSSVAGTVAYVAALIPTGLTAGERRGLVRAAGRLR